MELGVFLSEELLRFYQSDNSEESGDFNSLLLQASEQFEAALGAECKVELSAGDSSHVRSSQDRQGSRGSTQQGGPTQDTERYCLVHFYLGVVV